MTEIRSLSTLLDDLKTACADKESLSFGSLLEAFHERGFGFFLFILALPAALPIPAVGYGTILALPLLFLTAQQALGRHTIWFPQSVRKRSIKSQTLVGTVESATPWVKRIEYLVRPRLKFVTQGVSGNLIGIAGFLMACSVLLPFPLTNTIPSMGIALMAVGVIMRDGVAVLVGALIGLLWVSLLVGVSIYFGSEGLEILKSTIKSFL